MEKLLFSGDDYTHRSLSVSVCRCHSHTDICCSWLTASEHARRSWHTSRFGPVTRWTYWTSRPTDMKSALTHFIASTSNFSKREDKQHGARAARWPYSFLSVAFFQHGPVLPGNHTVNTAGFLEVLECHSVSHQRHQLSTTKHTHTHSHIYKYIYIYIYSTYTHKPGA